MYDFSPKNFLVICQYPGNLDIGPRHRVSQLMNIAFDMCAWEIWGALANGATLCIRGSSKTGWEDVLSSVDVVIATPSILSKYLPEQYPNIQIVATAGEPCPSSLAESWARNARFFNGYGPTEVSQYNCPVDIL